MLSCMLTLQKLPPTTGLHDARVVCCNTLVGFYAYMCTHGGTYADRGAVPGYMQPLDWLAVHVRGSFAVDIAIASSRLS